MLICLTTKIKECKKFKISEKGNFQCLECRKGYIPSILNVLCVKEPLNILFKNSGKMTVSMKKIEFCEKQLKSKCLECSQGHRISIDAESCIYCGDNVELCVTERAKNSLSIQKCFAKFEIHTASQRCIPQRRSQKNCIGGKYHDSSSDTCKDCSEKCVWCHTSDKCLECTRGFELSAESKCVKMCNIRKFLRSEEEEYYQDQQDDNGENQIVCEKCSKCQFCQEGSKRMCGTCLKCQLRCQVFFSKRGHNLYVLEVPDFEVDLESLQDSQPNFKIKQTNPGVFHITIGENSNNNENFIIRTEFLKMYGCLTNTTLYEFKTSKDQIFGSGGTKFLTTMKTLAYLQDVLIPITATVFSKMYILVDVLNMSKLYNYIICDNDPTQSVSGYVKGNRIGGYVSGEDFISAKLLMLSETEKIDLFYAFIQSPLKEVAFQSLLSPFALVIPCIFLLLWFADSFSRKNLNVFKQVKKFFNLKKTQETFDEAQFIRKHVKKADQFRYWKSRPRLLKFCNAVFIKISSSRNVYWSHMLSALSISYAQILMRLITANRLFPRIFLFRSTLAIIPFYTFFFFQIINIQERVLTLSKIKKKEPHQILEIASLKTGVYNFFFFHGIIAIVCFGFRFRTFFNPVVLCYIGAAIAVKLFLYKIPEPYFCLICNEVSLLIYFNFSRTAQLYSLEGGYGFIFDLFFVFLNISQIISLILSWLLK